MCGAAVVTQSCVYTKNCWNMHFKMVNFMLYELNLNFKSIEKKSEWRRFPPLQGSTDRVHMIQNSCTLWGECRCFLVSTQKHMSTQILYKTLLSQHPASFLYCAGQKTSNSIFHIPLHLELLILFRFCPWDTFSGVLKVQELEEETVRAYRWTGTEA